MEPSGSRLRAEILKASGAAWPYGSSCGLVALMGPGGGLLALFLALLLRAFSGVVGPPKASPQPAPPAGRSFCSGCRADGSFSRMPTGDGDTESAKARPVVSGLEGRAVILVARRTPLTARPGHGPHGTSRRSQIAGDGSDAWYSSRYGYMSELENRKRRGPLRGPSRRIAPGASRPPVEACAQTHGNAVTVPLWPVAPQPNGWDHPGTCPGVYQAGIRPRGAAWGPHEPRIRGIGVWGGLGPM